MLHPEHACKTQPSITNLPKKLMTQKSSAHSDSTHSSSEAGKTNSAWAEFIQIAEKVQIPDDFMVDREDDLSEESRDILNEISE